MAAPIIAASGALVVGATASSGTHNFAKPSGVVVGSMLVAIYTVEHNGSGTQLAAPTNWAPPPGTPAFQAVANGTALYVWWRYADAIDADPGTTQYAMPVQSGRWVRGGVLRIADHATTNPWDAGNGAVAANSTDVPSTSVTTTGPDRLLLWGASSYNLTPWATMPSGFTEIGEFEGASSNTTTAAQRTLTTAATVTTGAIATGATAGKAGWTGAIKPVDAVATISGTADVTLGALSVAATAGPQLRTGTVAVNPGGVSLTATGLRTTAGVASVTLGATAVTARQAILGAANITLGALSVAATGAVAQPPPGQLFDLSRVHLTLPTEDPGPGTNAQQINQPELATYSGPHFYTTAAGRMRFVAPVTGAVTSSAAGGTRSELRAHEADYDEEAFDPHTTGRRQVTLTTRVDASNITGGSNPRKEAICFQIHGAASSPIPLILSAEYHVATPRIRIFKNGPGFANPVTGITPTTDITIRCRVEDATVRLWVIAGQKEDLPSIATTAPYEWPVSDFTDDVDWYFKPGGIYNKTPADSGSTGESSAEVSFLEILQPGDPDPTGEVLGTAAITLGGLNVAVTGRRQTAGSAAVTLGALNVAAVGTVMAEVVPGTAAVTLGALITTAVGQRTTYGEAAAILGALSVQVSGSQTVTGTAAVSLGPVSVTAVGTVVAEVVVGTASVAIADPIITAVGSRAAIGSAAVALPALIVTVTGGTVHPRLTAGPPTPVPGPYAGTPAPVRGPYADTPIAVRGPSAGTPIAR